jgi:hypothetical protein
MLFGAPSIRLVERPWRENKGVPTMTELIHELGPVGWLVIEFPGNGFDSEIPLTISAACLVGQNRWTRRTASALAAPAASSSSTVAFGAGTARFSRGQRRRNGA